MGDVYQGLVVGNSIRWVGNFRVQSCSIVWIWSTVSIRIHFPWPGP